VNASPTLWRRSDAAGSPLWVLGGEFSAFARQIGECCTDNAPTVDTGSGVNDAQAAADSAAESNAIQSTNDTNALTASMAAAEQENDAANAATLQTEINAGM
jgi:hypothetical protein